MKKIISLILALLMILSVVACFASCAEKNNEDNGERKKHTVPSNGKDAFGRTYIEDSITDDMYYKNAEDNTVRIFTRDASGGNDGQYMLLEFKGNASANSTINDAILSRNKEVEDRLGVELEITTKDGTMGDASTEWFNTLKTAAESSYNDTWDIAAIYASQGSNLATQGVFLDVNLLPSDILNLDQVWWNQTLVDELTIKIDANDTVGSLFMLCGDISLTSTALAHTIFYNKSMYSEYIEKDAQFTADYAKYEKYEKDGDSLIHGIIRGDGWDIDTFSDIAKKISVGTKGSSDAKYGLTIYQSSMPLDAWVAALDIELVTRNSSTNEYELAFKDQTKLSKANQAWNKSKSLLTENVGVHVITDSEKYSAIDEFSNGQALFTMLRLCDAESFRDTGDWEVGVLPLPKYNKTQTYYYTLPHNAYSLIVVAPNIERSKEEMVTATLELLAAESYRQVTPAYFEAVCKTQYSDRPVDADMYDILLNNIKLDFGTIFSTVALKGIAMPIRGTGESFTKNYSTNAKTYEDALEKLISGLKETAVSQRQ